MSIDTSRHQSTSNRARNHVPETFQRPNASALASHLRVSPRLRMNTPGAFAMVRRGHREEDESEWDPTEPIAELNDNQSDDGVSFHDASSAEDPDEGYLDATVSQMGSHKHRSTKPMWRILAIATVALVVGIVVIVLTCLPNNNTSNGSVNGLSPDETLAPVDICDFNDAEEADPLLQCTCKKEITFISTSLQSQYAFVKQFIIPTLFDTFNHDIKSCEPQNLALLWLATDYDAQSIETCKNRYLLALLYLSWQGSQWTNSTGWLTSDQECLWKGVNCSETTVSGLNLADNNLHGTLPSEIALIEELRLLDLQHNNITGSLPTQLGYLMSLEHLVLDNNVITGPIPSQISALENLMEISMGTNAISGTIPLELINLRKLNELTLDTNKLAGSIPETIGTLFFLTTLDLSANSLTGTIPDSIGSLVNLRSCILDDNELTGTVPSTIGGMTSLVGLSLSFNFLNSSMVTEIGLLTNLVEIKMESAKLGGTLPSELGYLTKLGFLDVSSNTMSGTIPSTLGNLVNASVVKLHRNYFEGTMPEQLCSLRESKAQSNPQMLLTVFCTGIYSNPKLQCSCCDLCEVI